MATHLSARIAWHDSAWNGSVCRQPSCNPSCVVHDYIRDAWDDAREDGDAGRPFPELDEIVAEIVARRLVEYLERAGFVVMKRPPIGGGTALGRGFEG